MAAEAGQLQFNAFEPLIVHSLHKSISHLEAAYRTLKARCTGASLPIRNTSASPWSSPSAWSQP
ncbi:aspartate ammonia-lyase [Arthrobacter globiformis]|nr:aspartate ammonia-lyase [Arthrobacter globiformis]